MKAIFHNSVILIHLKSDCRVHHSLDEASPEEHRQRHLHQAPGGGEGEKRQLRSRCLRVGEGGWKIIFFDALTIRSFPDIQGVLLLQGC